MEVGSFKSVGIAEPGQPLITMLRENSPKEGVKEVTKNYNLQNDQQTLKSQAYSKQPASFPQNKISQQTKDLIRKLLMTKIRLAGISGVTSISDGWLEGYINARYELITK